MSLHTLTFDSWAHTCTLIFREGGWVRSRESVTTFVSGDLRPVCMASEPYSYSPKEDTVDGVTVGFVSRSTEILCPLYKPFLAYKP